MRCMLCLKDPQTAGTAFPLVFLTLTMCAHLHRLDYRLHPATAPQLRGRGATVGQGLPLRAKLRSDVQPGRLRLGAEGQVDAQQAVLPGGSSPSALHAWLGAGRQPARRAPAWQRIPGCRLRATAGAPARQPAPGVSAHGCGKMPCGCATRSRIAPPGSAPSASRAPRSRPRGRRPARQCRSAAPRLSWPWARAHASGAAGGWERMGRGRPNCPHRPLTPAARGGAQAHLFLSLLFSSPVLMACRFLVRSSAMACTVSRAASRSRSAVEIACAPQRLPQHP